MCLWAWPATLVHGAFEMGFVKMKTFITHNGRIGKKRKGKPKYKLHTVFVGNKFALDVFTFFL